MLLCRPWRVDPVSSGQQRTVADRRVSAAGQDYDVVEKTLDRDHFMSAEEARAFGIVDEVYSSRPGVSDDEDGGKGAGA